MLGPAPPHDPAEFAQALPHDLQAEQITLGSMMLSPRVLAEITGIVRTPADYYRPAHQVVHEAILRLYEAREPTDAASVRMELERTGELRGALDGVYVFSLTQAVPTAANGPYYAREVARHARTRRAQEGLTHALQITRSTGFTPDEDMDRVRQAVDAATGEQAIASAAWLADAVYETVDALDKPLPPDQITPPYTDLREYVPALRPGQLITIAARPSIGKTVVAGDFARHAALKLHLPVAWFSLEMTREELIIRSLAAEALVDQEHLQQHTLSEREWDQLGPAVKAFGESQLLIDDQSAATLAHIRSGLRTMSRIAAPRMAVFDYLQLGTSPGAPSRQEEVSRLTRGLKDIAKEWDIPVVMAAQLNRNPEGRHDKRPLQSDLRESGEIENSSDVVILLNREEYYDPETRPGEMDLIVSKNRNGRTGTATVIFQGKFCRCVNKALTPASPGSWAASSTVERS
jgi:replicative DNA helicase